MSKPVRLVVLSVILLGSVAFAQLPGAEQLAVLDDQDKKPTEQLTMQQLKDENAKLRQQVAKLKRTYERTQDQVEQQVEPRIDVAFTGKNLSVWMDVMAEQLRQAETSESAREVARHKQVQSLKADLLTLEDREVALRRELGGISSPAAIDRIVERLAEAQIENRLRLLEAQAMVHVLEQSRGELESKVKEQAEFAVQHAETLVKQRQDELQAIQKRIARTLDSGKRQQLDAQRVVAESALRRAEIAAQQAQQETGARITADINRRLVDAATEVAVSEHLARALAEEANRISVLLMAGSDFSQIKNEVEALRKELVELKLKAYEEQKEAETRRTDLASNRVERELLFPLLVRRKVLRDSVGAGHPSLVIVENRIGLVKQQVEELRQSERELIRRRVELVKQQVEKIRESERELIQPRLERTEDAKPNKR